MLFPMFMLDICCQRSLYTCLIFSAFTTATCIHACIPLWVRRSSNLKFLLCISYVVKADAWKSKTSKAGCYIVLLKVGYTIMQRTQKDIRLNLKRS